MAQTTRQGASDTSGCFGLSLNQPSRMVIPHRRALCLAMLPCEHACEDATEPRRDSHAAPRPSLVYLPTALHSAALETP